MFHIVCLINDKSVRERERKGRGIPTYSEILSYLRDDVAMNMDRG